MSRYNPYTDAKGLFAEVYDENPGAFKGPDPLGTESMFAYTGRMQWERGFYRQNAAKKLSFAAFSVFGFLLLFLLMRELLASTAVSVFGFFPGASDTVLNLTVSIAQYLVVGGILIYLYSATSKINPLGYFQRPRVSGLYIAKWTVIGFGISRLAAIINSFIFSIIGQFVYLNEQMSVPKSLPEFIMYFFAVVVLAPLFEELIFRGVLFSRLAKFGEWFAIIVTGILFGLFHAYYDQIFFAAVFGIVLGFINCRAKSIVPSVIAHAVFNGFSFFMSVTLSFTNAFDPNLAPDAPLNGAPWAVAVAGFSNILIFASAGIAAVLLAWELFRHRERFTLESDAVFTQKEKLSFLFSRPMAVAFMIVIIFYTVLNSFVDMSVFEEMLESIESLPAE